MFKKIADLITKNRKDTIAPGLGMPKLPNEVYRGKQLITGKDFKLIVNEHFLPKIYEKGFRGKDFFFYRQNEIYTEIVFFWIHKVGGAIQVDLSVKFNSIIYPGSSVQLKTSQLRPENCEFQKRLSPNGQKVWFWIFKDNLNDNIKLVEDIWRLFSEIGVNYFKQFENHKTYIQQIDNKKYLTFPDFQLTKIGGRFERGIIFFLFEYWRQHGDEAKASMFAKVGSERVRESSYLKVFNDYITNGRLQ